MPVTDGSAAASKQTGAVMLKIALAIAAAVLFCAPAGFAQKKGDELSNTRSVQGTVTTPEESPVDGAIVQLKNTKNLQIRSFIAKDGGNYYFQGLSPDVDYELKAEFQGSSSPTKTLSSFDSRKKAIINLKLNKK
jgi:hypothetical protein